MSTTKTLNIKLTENVNNKNIKLTENVNNKNIKQKTDRKCQQQKRKNPYHNMTAITLWLYKN
jgi:hypothetical protein